jgi:hypothetical protein
MSKKIENEIYMVMGEILSKERKEITFSYSAKSDVPMCDIIHTHTSFAFALPSIP